MDERREGEPGTADEPTPGPLPGFRLTQKQGREGAPSSCAGPAQPSPCPLPFLQGFGNDLPAAAALLEMVGQSAGRDSTSFERAHLNVSTGPAYCRDIQTGWGEAGQSRSISGRVLASSRFQIGR
jgi:hypothetical protein